jgi:hypothetical protein
MITAAPMPAPLRRRLTVTLLIALPLAGFAGAASAHARGGGEGGAEVRVAGSCGSGATSKLRLRARDQEIRVQFEVDQSRSGALWRVVLVQDRRVAWRGHARTGGVSDSFEIQLHLRDLPGADGVTARAWGPGGVTCAASATLPA